MSPELPDLIDDDMVAPVEVELPYKYVPRDYQEPLWNAFFPTKKKVVPKKRGVLVWHRRSGKDKSAFNLIISKAMERVGYYLYFLPTLTQGRKVIWKGFDKSGFKFINHIPPEIIARTNATEMTVELVNGSIIQIGGADNYNAYMGTNPVGIVFSEYSLINPNAWDHFRPILVENDGWALFEYTPRGRNHGYFMFQTAKRMARDPESGWFVSHLTVDDTRSIGKKAIEEERDAGMSADMIDQEFYCSFEAFNRGAYYSKQLKRAWKEKRITIIPIDPGLPVHTVWDIGFSDSTAIWLFQVAGKEVRLVAYYENSGESLVHYINWLKDWRDSKECIFGEHWAPHDMEVHEFSTGKTRTQFAKKHGINFKIVPDIGFQDGIESTRVMFSRLYIDEAACENGLAAITDYQRAYDEKNKCYKPRPPRVHWANHGSDALRYLSVIVDMVKNTKIRRSQRLQAGATSWNVFE